MSLVELVLYVDTGKLYDEFKKADPRLDAHLLVRLVLVIALSLNVLITIGWVAASLCHKRYWLIGYAIVGFLLIPSMITKEEDEQLRHYKIIEFIPFASSLVLALVQSHMIGRKLHKDSLNVGVYYPAPDSKLSA